MKRGRPKIDTTVKVPDLQYAVKMVKKGLWEFKASRITHDIKTDLKTLKTVFKVELKASDYETALEKGKKKLLKEKIS